MTANGEAAIGVDESARALLVSVLSRHPQVNEAWLFGSRAMGTHRPESDIDIALHGNVDERLAARIAGELDELPLPYTFDVCAYSSVRHLPLREHIDRVGLCIFTRASSGP